MNPRWAVLAVAAAGVLLAWLAMRPLPVERSAEQALPRTHRATPPRVVAREETTPTPAEVRPPPPTLGDPELAAIIERQIAEAHPALSVTGRTCSEGTCVTALAIGDARVADAAHSAALNVAVSAGQGLDAQPVLRWNTATGIGHLYFVPNDASPDEKDAIQHIAQDVIDEMSQ